MGQKSSQYSIIDDDENIDEERIESLVKAAEIIQEEKINNSQSNNSEKSLSFWDNTSHDIPEYKKYAAKGRVVDIKFDYNFEQKLKESSLKELLRDNIEPKKIKLYFSDGLGEEWYESYSYQSEQTKIQNILSSYGNGRIDNIVGKKVNLKPNRQGRLNKYEIIIPDNTATSKLRMKLTTYRSKLAPRKSNPKIGYLKFILSNLIRFGLSASILALYSFYLYKIYEVSLEYITHENSFQELINIILGLGLLTVLSSLFILYLSFIFGLAMTNSKEPVGIIEQIVIYYIKKLEIKIYGKFTGLNTWLGQKI